MSFFTLRPYIHLPSGRKSLAWLNIGYSYSSRSLEFILSAPSLFLFVLSFRWVSGFTNSGLHRRTNESLGLGSWPHSRRQSRTGRACFLLESQTGAYVRRNESKEDVAEQLRPPINEIPSLIWRDWETSWRDLIPIPPSSLYVRIDLNSIISPRFQSLWNKTFFHRYNFMLPLVLQ